jgi:hypothetical protein
MLQKNLAKLNFNQYLELYKPKEAKSGNSEEFLSWVANRI